MPFRQCPRAVAIIVFLLLPGSLGCSQSKWEKAAWVTGSVVALGAYDYVGYNLTRNNPTALGIYRVSFVLLQVGLTYILYEKFGLPSAIAINLIWWTFGTDMVFYGLSEVSPIRGGTWSGPGSWEVDSKSGIPHAGWTPVGLIRGGERIPSDTIVGQSIIGAVIGIGICITF